MNLKSLLAAGLTLAALALPMSGLAQDAAAPGAADDTVLSPSGTAGTPAAAIRDATACAAVALGGISTG